MAAERRVAVLSRQFTNAVDVDIVSKTSLRDFDADEVYRFLTRDNLELRARMLDHLKVRGCRIMSGIHKWRLDPFKAGIDGLAR